MSENAKPSRLGVNAAFMMEIKDDHQHLRELLTKLRRFVANRHHTHHHFQEFVDLLYGLCDQLAFHFALEEAFGYFEDALESAPHLHEQSTKLRNQHSQLFVNARDLADKAANRTKPAAADIDLLIHEFRALDVALKVHESAEKGLVHAALSQDVGVGD